MLWKGFVVVFLDGTQRRTSSDCVASTEGCPDVKTARTCTRAFALGIVSLQNALYITTFAVTCYHVKTTSGATAFFACENDRSGDDGQETRKAAYQSDAFRCWCERLVNRDISALHDDGGFDRM